MKSAKLGYGTRSKHINLDVKDLYLLRPFLVNWDEIARLTSQPPPLSSLHGSLSARPSTVRNSARLTAFTLNSIRRPANFPPKNVFY